MRHLPIVHGRSKCLFAGTVYPQKIILWTCDFADEWFQFSRILLSDQLQEQTSVVAAAWQHLGE
jgi:hypothetical protein